MGEGTSSGVQITPQRELVNGAWNRLNPKFRDFINTRFPTRDDQDAFFEIVSQQVRLDILDEGRARSARDRLNATIAQYASEVGNGEIYNLMLETMRNDIRLYGQMIGKEKAR